MHDVAVSTLSWSPKDQTGVLHTWHMYGMYFIEFGPRVVSTGLRNVKPRRFNSQTYLNIKAEE